jgi:putative transposase
MKYGRARQEGGAYFFTVSLAERSSTLLVDRIDDLRHAVRTVKQRHPFEILVWVVLPDHLHAVWTLPAGGGDCATRWMLIKAGFSRAVPKGERIRASRRRKGERGLWQRQLWEHLITDGADLQSHVATCTPTR